MANYNQAEAQREAAAERAKEEAERRAEERKREEEAKKKAEEAAKKKQEEAAKKKSEEEAKKKESEKKDSPKKDDAKASMAKSEDKGHESDPKSDSKSDSKSKSDTAKENSKNLAGQPHALRDAKDFLKDADANVGYKDAKVTNKEAKEFLDKPGPRTHDYEEVKRLIDRGMSPGRVQAVVNHVLPSMSSIEDKSHAVEKTVGEAAGNQGSGTFGGLNDLVQQLFGGKVPTSELQQSGITSSPNATGTGAAQWVSNPTNSQQLATDVLIQINKERAAKGESQIPLNQGNIEAMTAWGNAESSNGVDAYNFGGTTLSEPGSYGTNAPGVQSYPNAQEGVDAAASMIQQSNMAPILQSLLSGNQSPTNQGNLGYAVANTPWEGGPGSDTTIIEQALGGSGASPDSIGTSQGGASPYSATSGVGDSSGGSSGGTSTPSAVPSATDSLSTGYSNPFSSAMSSLSSGTGSLPLAANGAVSPLLQTLQSNSGQYSEPGTVNTNQPGSSPANQQYAPEQVYSQLLALLPNIAPRNG